MKRKYVFFEIADVVIKIEIPEKVIKEDVPYSNFLTVPKKESIRIGCDIVPNLPNTNKRLIYHDTRNLVYKEDMSIRYIGHFEKAGNIHGASCYIYYDCANLDYYKVVLKENDLISLDTILSGIGIDFLMARKHRVILHSSFISYKGNGIVFTAPSGTGKSTQAELWRINRSQVEIINGDRSILSCKNGMPIVYSLPFCGSSGIALNKSVPLQAIVILRQGKENKILKLSSMEAIKQIYSECSVSPWDRQCVQNILEVLSDIVARVPVYLLSCLPEKSAVDLLDEVLQKGELLNE